MSVHNDDSNNDDNCVDNYLYNIPIKTTHICTRDCKIQYTYGPVRKYLNDHPELVELHPELLNWNRSFGDNNFIDIPFTFHRKPNPKYDPVTKKCELYGKEKDTFISIKNYYNQNNDNIVGNNNIKDTDNDVDNNNNNDNKDTDYDDTDDSDDSIDIDIDDYDDYDDDDDDESDDDSDICKNNITMLDEIVIPDNEITINFHYPLNNLYPFIFKSESGFTRGQLLNHICKTYHEIYKEEEETSSDKTFILTKNCTKCKHVINWKDDVINQKTNDQCDICFNTYVVGDIIKILNCNHIFHTSCLTKWFDENKTCPYCRISCCGLIKCNNNKCVDGIYTFEYIGKVPPTEIRRKHSDFQNRPASNGKYEICGHDIDDLVIETITYDPETKVVYMFIGS